MHLGLRLIFAFLAITGVAAVFVLRVFVSEIKPSVREVVEDLMVDTANLLAEVAAPELAALAPGALLGEEGPFAAAVRVYEQRRVDARIWGLHKTTLDLRITLTDARGRVVFDSGRPSAAGQDHSRWRDVLLTLRGEYGARTTRAVAGDDGSSVMHVAAPVYAPVHAPIHAPVHARAAGPGAPGRPPLGVLVVAKPLASIAPFVERAERKVLWAGVGLLGASLAIGAAVTWWVVARVRRLQRYALDVAAAAGGESGGGPGPPQAPELPGELGELARAMDRMRSTLERREQQEQRMRALTHELKSPLAAIRGAGELLQEELSAEDRRRFLRQVQEQGERLQHIVEQMLELSKLESLKALPHHERLDLLALTEDVLAQHRARIEQRALALQWLERADAGVAGDRALLALALSNLLANALAAAPQGSVLELGIARAEGGVVRWWLRDHGPGVPEYARAQLGERLYYATAPAGSTTRGSGLGLAIVRQVVRLHGARLAFEAAEPGLRVTIELPAR
jgi:two-component system sensor histidine kinase CreC